MARGTRRTGVRVVAGAHRGLKLETPPDASVRPTADRVKEALFSMLGPGITGGLVADLFAGTGSLGIEALSRGADHVVFVERDPEVAALLRRNLQRLDRAGDWTLVTGDALRPDRWGGARPLDWVLADPPYRQGLAPRLLAALAGADVLAADATVVVEHEPGAEAGPATGVWRELRRRRYGDTELSWFRLEPEKGI